MLRSMTGYGRGKCIQNNRKITVELKSVNHRFNDVSIKSPRILNSFEDQLRKKISSIIFRGKTDIYISLESYAKDDIKIHLNKPLADAYMTSLKTIQKRYQLTNNISTAFIAKFPDVITVERNMDNVYALHEIWEATETALHQALDQLIQMRENEGVALKNDLDKKMDLLRSLMVNIKNRAPFVVQDYRARLSNRLQETLPNLAFEESRLLTEVAIFADKACIDEEIIRFESHLDQMSDTLNQSEPVGRKLDFLIQEMNREINTIGSKSNDIAITKLVVELKSEIEKIREQIQNIE